MFREWIVWQNTKPATKILHKIFHSHQPKESLKDMESPLGTNKLRKGHIESTFLIKNVFINANLCNSYYTTLVPEFTIYFTNLP